MSYLLIVPTKENLSDGFTKNVNRDTYRAHTPNYVRAREYWNEEYEEAKVDENEQSYGGDEVDWLLWRCEKIWWSRRQWKQYMRTVFETKRKGVGRFWLQIQSYELETRNIENGTAR